MMFLDCKKEKKNLSDIKYFLRSKGILVYSTDDYSDVPDFDSKTGIWVVFHHQLHDAQKLLKNKKHQVINPFTQDQIKIFEKNSKEIFFKSSQSFFERIFAIILGVFLFGFILFVIYHAV